MKATKYLAASAVSALAGIVAVTDALRAGRYSKTLTFTLSTTNP